MAEEEDRISSLPDCLLLEIISRIKVTFIEFDYPPKEKERLMTTKEVIKTTSTISKRWQHLWTKLPNLEICRNRFQDGSDYTGHVLCMSKTLTQCPIDVNLNKFELCFEYTSNDTTTSWFTSQINSWIRHAITRNVQEVDLWLCDLTLGEFSCDDELFFNNSCITRMKIMASCKFNPPNVMLGRIDTASKRFKNLVLTDYNIEYRRNYIGADYIDTFEINAPYMLSLTIKGKMCFEKFLLLDVSSLVKADLNYRGSHRFADKLGRRRDDIEEELLRTFIKPWPCQ
ncbi:ribonuclease H-like domain-containing protein [Tanacetum coccineum]